MLSGDDDPLVDVIGRCDTGHMTNDSIAAMARTASMHVSAAPSTIPAGSDRKSLEIAAAIKASQEVARKQAEAVNRSVDQLRLGLVAALENHMIDEQNPADE
jgi:hypothetical protein